MSRFRLSCDDGCASDVRVADLAERHEIECIFYWPVEMRSLAYDNGYEPLDILDALHIAQRFEIGSHTVTHRHLTRLPRKEAEHEISDSKFMLEALFARPINKFCPPRGYTNEQLTEYTLKFYEEQRLTRGEGLVHVHPNSGANHNIPWRQYADSVDVEELWFHSWELDKYNLWQELEEYLASSSR